MNMLLENKSAVIYGAGGAIGGAIARAFAREGAKVFLAGRQLSSVEAVVTEIRSAGGEAEAALVNALDEQEIEKHLRTVAEKADGIDISVNAIGIPQQEVQGTSLVELSKENFAIPITTYTQTTFLTGRAAARYMIKKHAGVILTITATPARMAAPLMGGMAPAWAAVEALTRIFAAELGPQGIRAIGLRSHAIPETETISEANSSLAAAQGISLEQFNAQLSAMTLLQRLPTLVELANVAAFLSSDQASAMTATVVNLSCGVFVD
jgi:NAD(P)-dependent dehydrogenase (short-subunit alcohol dehydrogenase family)